MIYIKLQNYCVFFFEVYFEGGTTKMYLNQLKDVCNGFCNGDVCNEFFDKIAG